MILDNSPDVAAWVASHIPGCARGWSNCQAIGVVDDDGIIAGVVFHNWSPESAVIEMSAAATSPRWAPRAVLRCIFGYPFDGLKCRMVAMRVSERNERMCAIARRLGCREYYIDDLRADGEADIVFTLTAAAWRRFLGGTRGQASVADAA